MYAFIKGRIDSKFTGSAVIDAGGVGYRLYTSLKSLERMGVIGEETKLYTYLHVREDAMLLYGFYTQEELSCFELLISVSGVGPKAALALLSKHIPSKISLAVVSGDYKLLQEAPGIGGKIAQRVVLELKDKILKESKDVELAEIIFVDQTGAGDTGTGAGSVAKEAMSALMVLGYSQTEAGGVVSKAYKEGMTVEDVIKESLRRA